jgi:hypothetical protein
MNVFSKPKEASNKQRETEIVLYARIHNFDNLKLADKKESHEQWSINAPFGKVRVRKTTSPELAPKFESTVKTRNGKLGVNDGDETNLACDENYFESFKAISSEGMIKDRFVFKASKVTMKGATGDQNLNANEDIAFEVDVFKDKQGNYLPYVKIDIEINKLMARLGQSKLDTTRLKFDISIRQLPLQLTDVIRGDDESEDARSFIKELYSKYFITKRTPGADEAPVSDPPKEGENLQSPSNEAPAQTPQEPVQETDQETEGELPPESEPAEDKK